MAFFLKIHGGADGARTRDLLNAIDLNVAPGLGGTGLEEWIFGREVFEELAGFFGEQTSELAV